MFFEPITKSLYDDEGDLIKRLHCPKRQLWDTMSPGPDASRTCAACDAPVLDTERMTAAQVVEAVRSSPDACLMVKPDQANIYVKVGV